MRRAGEHLDFIEREAAVVVERDIAGGLVDGDRRAGVGIVRVELAGAEGEGAVERVIAPCGDAAAANSKEIGESKLNVGGCGSSRRKSSTASSSALTESLRSAPTSARAETLQSPDGPCAARLAAAVEPERSNVKCSPS